MLKSGETSLIHMLTTELEIDELKRAYQLLNVPYSASERAINQAYRRLIKRWHPDRYASGTPAHAEATQMMKLINEAHSQIANAPLHNYDEQTAAAQRQTSSGARRSSRPDAGTTYAHDSYAASMYANDAYVTDTGMERGRVG